MVEARVVMVVRGWRRRHEVGHVRELCCALARTPRQRAPSNDQDGYPGFFLLENMRVEQDMVLVHDRKAGGELLSLLRCTATINFALPIDVR